MERTLLHHTTIIEPYTSTVQTDGALTFNHENPVYPPDKIGYAGARDGKGAPDIEHPLAEDAVLDMEGTYLLPGLIDLSCVIYDLFESTQDVVLSAYRNAGNALNRGVTSIGCLPSSVNVAVQKAGDDYMLWTPCIVCKKPLQKHGYAVLHGVPEAGTPEESEYLTAVKKAVAAKLKPAVATDLKPDAKVNGLPALVRAAQLLCMGGYTCMEAIAAVTCNGAALLGIDGRTGKLCAGYEGDVIAVEGNPLEDITALASMKLCARGGRLIWSHLKGFERTRLGLVPPGCPD